MALCISILFILFTFSLSQSHAANSKLFREYIGAESDSIKFSDVPINSEVEFHFILSFAIDYAIDGDHASPTNGNFEVFWESKHLSPAEVASIKRSNSNVKVALSLGGDTVVGNQKAYFTADSISSWLENAESSLTKMIQDYNVDGIDIDYEHFSTSREIFVECIGKLVTRLKKSGTISFASIAPYEDDQVQSHYLALWAKYGHVIDYVNFQFYAYDKLSVPQFVSYFNEQASNYAGGQILASFMNHGGGLSPENGFFDACNDLMKQGKLGGIFIWCADESTEYGFKYEKQSQQVLAST